MLTIELAPSGFRGNKLSALQKRSSIDLPKQQYVLRPTHQPKRKFTPITRSLLAWRIPQIALYGVPTHPLKFFV